MRPESTPKSLVDKPSKRVINDRCYFGQFCYGGRYRSGGEEETYSSQLLPLTAASSSSVIRCPVVKYPSTRGQSVSPTVSLGTVWGSNTGKLTCGNFGINLDSRVCRNPRLGQLNSLMDGNASFSQHLRYFGFCCTSGFLTLDQQ